ncbi:kinase-like domain-containing protein [Rhizophagus irregularis DAOM 181602=DAOM 197198]|uniref:Protein kinase domain-containing protein n=2 Tax=Rhizophagus irregularis TaxID=588596 RepID=A0A015JHE6_RHIIW|nr:hypothetical protein GLOIN_2v1552433 [Rhizophagus irregularis DAOM 181602=DAOM 197198]EXX68928.1 hypothetical protein RirG_100600 [Rhizophagus irregularis DAOM 197198w]EXX68929.1 hypothetical protein RirG_100600 [Rhizophagus irregularis DAOM 197198w]EXX68930.1 hypothetical protein RirG_100600 [Rhizophagus irregularis DAOM 197198w]EXX68931.1 hypothetical protein RirG_100600 [Rhizophagus irregularis DAOM 197198w]EXX68932.1 hypothetical protein RirG_100600 [Rhizophagus irregularis DAOM 197198w|eukprot:XP_025183647.1 hypothetical protein GLOIN_2v1552433 [Rhizophagus irregularis DAOM 181602=DAOM 197198]
MLMWEISSGQPPFINYEHNYYLAMNIVNGLGPKIVSGTPLEYKKMIVKDFSAKIKMTIYNKNSNVRFVLEHL